MRRTDLENYFRANNGNLISINGFLSSTTDRYVARIFAGDGHIENSDTHLAVLYEIEIDTRLPRSVLFAELSGQTKLTLTTDEDEQWNILTEHLQEKKEEES
ncbi:unnamed protein product [Rotaria socialis]|uniref:Uncharacterized protein n=1 Tax=Rotaria socialis TaxID=392032 RepID=A0A821M7F3_9BILA|nr:unnamed protein product [Rotaria socialis]CAF4763865.1 unnamed protein product [Rotaria socialis]